MPVKVRCPGCKKVLNAPDQARGKAVRCPGCQTPIRIPGEAATARAAQAPARKKAAAKRPDSVAMLAALDLGKIEDRSARICPRCTAEVPEGEVECPECGVNVQTGTFSEKAKKKRKRSGPDTALFYKDVIKNAGRFVKANMYLVVRTSMIFTFFTALFFVFVFLSLYVATWPPQTFYIFLAAVCALIPPGWLWLMQVRVTDASMLKKDKIKRKDFPLDIFMCAAMGLKAYGWLIVFTLPIQIVTGLIGGICLAMGQPIVGYVFFGLGFLIALLMLPIVMTHMAMPVTYRGWLFPRIAQIFKRVAGPVLYVNLLHFASILLLLAAIGATSAIFAKDVGTLVGQLRHNADIKWARQYRPPIGQKMDPVIEAKGRENLKPFDPPVGAFIPFATILACCAAFGVVAVYDARVNGRFAFFFREDLDLISQQEELKYVAKTEEEQTGRETTPKEIAVVYGIVTALAIMGGIFYGGVSPSVNVADGISIAFIVTGLLVMLVGSVMILAVAFEESALWGIAIILFGLLPVEMVFIVLNWSASRAGFFVQLSAIPYAVIGVIIGAVMGSRPVF